MLKPAPDVRTAGRKLRTIKCLDCLAIPPRRGHLQVRAQGLFVWLGLLQTKLVLGVLG